MTVGLDIAKLMFSLEGANSKGVAWGRPRVLAAPFLQIWELKQQQLHMSCRVI